MSLGLLSWVWVWVCRGSGSGFAVTGYRDCGLLFFFFCVDIVDYELLVMVVSGVCSAAVVMIMVVEQK